MLFPVDFLKRKYRIAFQSDASVVVKLIGHRKAALRSQGELPFFQYFKSIDFYALLL